MRNPKRVIDNLVFRYKENGGQPTLEDLNDEAVRIEKKINRLEDFGIVTDEDWRRYNKLLERKEKNRMKLREWRRRELEKYGIECSS